jgi:ornithine cyclodeaminase
MVLHSGPLDTVRELLWISEADVVATLDMGEAVSALEEGLAWEAGGECKNMVKTHVGWGSGHTLHAIGAAVPREGLVGTKTWAHAGGGASPLLILWDSETGELRAVIEAFALGNLRTGAISGVATARLAQTGADSLAVIGTGHQALPQVAAVAAVRPLRSVTVHSRDPDRRVAFAARVEAELGIATRVAASVAEAVAAAPIITLVTRATEPFLLSRMVAPGTHINAVGAILPERAEFEPALLDRCAVVAADSLAQVQNLSREFKQHYSERGWDGVETLSSVVGRDGRRPEGADLTLFKAMGMGVSDLAVGVRCYREAVRRGLGRRLPQPSRAKVRLKAGNPASGG